MFNRNGLRTQSLISVFSCSCLRTMLCIFCQLLVIFFLYYSGITTNQMCQSLHSSTRIIGNGKGLIHFSEFPDLFEHLTDTDHLYLFPVRKKTTQNKEKKEKKKHSESPAPAVPGHIESPTGSQSDSRREHLVVTSSSRLLELTLPVLYKMYRL